MAWIETNSDYSQLIKYRPIAEAFLEKKKKKKEKREKGEVQKKEKEIPYPLKGF